MDSQAAGDIAAFIKGEPFRVPNRSRSFETRHAWRSLGKKSRPPTGEPQAAGQCAPYGSRDLEEAKIYAARTCLRKFATSSPSVSPCWEIPWDAVRTWPAAALASPVASVTPAILSVTSCVPEAAC